MEAFPGECVIENGNLIQKKPYYMASSNIDAFSLLSVQIKIPLPDSPPIHQILASKIQQLKALGMTNQEIADSMKIGRKCVAKGLTMECSYV